jgi:hypothetical protein
MANRRFIDFPIASTVNDNDIVLIWQDGLNKQTTKGTLIQGAPTSLEGLTDVDIAGLINGQILQYNSTTGKWENVDRTDINLSQLGDVSIVSPSNGQVLVYNSSTSKWENSSGGYVPYTGAVTTVDLGAQTIEAGSFVKDGGTSSQFLKADGSVDSSTYLTTGSAAATYVPYTGANQTVNLNTQQLQAGHTTLTTNGSTETLTINHTSGSGKAINVTKGGAGEGLYVNKTSGSGNAATIVGTLEATTLVKTGGTSSQFLKADGSVDSTTYQSTAEKAQPNGYASLDSNGKVPLTQINDALLGNVSYQGLWNASTNTPTLANPPSSGTKGYYYIVSTAGTFAGISFEVGDWIISNGSAWQKVDNTDAVSSVFGRTGNVVASNGDYNTSQVTENTNLYYTEARVNANANVAANTAARHNAVTLGTANGLSLSTQQLSLGLASAGVTGALSGTDWSTFNNKQNALTNPVTGTGTTNYLPKFTGASTIGNSQIFDNGTSVGIGTATSFPDGDSLLIQNSGVWNVTLGLNNTGSGGRKWNIFSTNTSFSQGAGRLLFYNATAGTNAMLITSDNNLLLGTTTDSGNGARLQVSGSNLVVIDATRAANQDSVIQITNSNAGGAATAQFFASNGTNRTQFFHTGTSYGTLGVLEANLGGIYNETSAGIALVAAGASGIIRFATGGATNERMRIWGSTGNVNIGSTPASDAGYKLDVNGTGRFSGTNYLVNTSTGIGATYQRILNTGGDVIFGINDSTGGSLLPGTAGYATVLYNNTNTDISFGTNQIERMRITSGGNVGIGTTIPQRKFVVSNNGANGLEITPVSSGTIMEVISYNRSTSAYTPLQFESSLYTFNQGNVLIGTQSDNGARLSIAGGRTFINTGQGSASTAAYTSYNNITFNDEFSDVARGPNKIITFGRGGGWVGGIGIHNDTQAYYAGGTHKWYKYNGTTATLNLSLDGSGNLIATGSITATSFFESSDATIKTLVQDDYQAKGIDSVVAKLYIKNGKQELGYYAQDLEGVLPSAVNKGIDGLLNLSYREVHTAKIAYLEQKIKQLENELGRTSK